MSRKDRECRGCGQGLIEGYRFCPNCGTPQPSPLRPEANPAPTFTPEAILASLEEGKQEQAAEANQAGSPEPVHETARVPPPQPNNDVPQFAAESIAPPPQEQAMENGPESRKREDVRYAVVGGTLLGLAIALVGFVAGAPWWGILPVAGFLGLGFWGHVLQERPKRRGERDSFRNNSIGTAPVRSRSIPQWVKIAVATRDGGTCRGCGSDYELQYDHVIPFSRGGSSDVNNIQLLCGRCNRRKSNRYIG